MIRPQVSRDSTPLLVVGRFVLYQSLTPTFMAARESLSVLRHDVNTAAVLYCPCQFTCAIVALDSTVVKRPSLSFKQNEMEGVSHSVPWAYLGATENSDEPWYWNEIGEPVAGCPRPPVDRQIVSSVWFPATPTKTGDYPDAGWVNFTAMEDGHISVHVKSGGPVVALGIQNGPKETAGEAVPRIWLTAYYREVALNPGDVFSEYMDGRLLKTSLKILEIACAVATVATVRITSGDYIVGRKLSV